MTVESVLIDLKHFKAKFHSSFSRYALLSDYLIDLYTGKSKKNFVKIAPSRN